MKKLLGIVVLGLGLIFLFKYSFSFKTYLKCEPYDQNSKEILYFAFDKRYIWSNYDPINSEFRNRSKAKYGERYVTAIWDNIKINREVGTIIITPSLASIFLDLFKKEETMPVLEEALKKGIQIQTHAIGDRGNKITLDWYKQAFDSVSNEERTINEPRWRIEHSQIITKKDQIRFRDMNIIASMQPSHAIGDLHFAPSRLGMDRVGNGYVWRNLIDLGVLIAGGSDAPVEIGDPLIEFYAAVVRKDLDGYYGEGWHLEQAVSREEALKMFTLWPAYAAFQEDVKGSLEVGKLADLTILSKDIMQIPEDEILTAEAVMTVVNGNIVFERK